MANNFIERDVRELNNVRFLDIYMMGHKGFIGGGCFKNIFQGQKIKDLDLFFETEKDFVDAKMYYETNEDYVFSYENKNIVAFKNKKTNIRIELVRSQFGTPDEIMKKFDFSITKFCYIKKQTENEDFSTSIEYKCLHHEFFFEHIMGKKLVLEPNILFPVSTFERTLRYTKYGYGLCRESKANLINSLQGADIGNLSNDLYFGFD